MMKFCSTVALGISVIGLSLFFSFGEAPASTLFDDAVSFVAGYGPTCVAVGDIDRDGHHDLAVTNDGSYPDDLGSVDIFLGEGDGTFAQAVSYGAGTQPHSIALGDFDRDGYQDLAVANTWSFDVSILLGEGDGTFAQAVSFDAGALPYSVAVGDFDGDGHQDLAVANAGSYPNDDGSVCIFLGEGDGTFAQVVSFDAGALPYSVAVGDFDGDEHQDLAVANRWSDEVSILINATPDSSCFVGLVI